MSILITEVAITAAGEVAIEITNTGAASFDLTPYPLAVGDTTGSGFAVNFGTAGLPTSIAAGDTITIGHSNIPDLDYYPGDQLFEPSQLGFVSVPDFSEGASAAIDSVGISASDGTAFGTDIVYTCDVTRTPDTNFFSGDNRGDFTVTAPFSTNTIGTPTIACFGLGTRIGTPQGDVRVECLKIGDLVRTADGNAVPVRWIGTQTLAPRRVAHGKALVQVDAGALGHRLPEADLTLTADHALLIDGLLINAGALVNHTTIRHLPADDLPARVTVYHVETDDHDIIQANGAPAETFIDYIGRMAFDNYNDYVKLYGADRIIREMDLPRISSARLVPPALRARPGRVEPATMQQVTDQTRMA